MSSFTYLLKAVVAAAYLLVAVAYLSKAVVAAAATTAGEATVHHILRRLSSSEEEEEEEKHEWAPFRNELEFRLAAWGGRLFILLILAFIFQVLLRICIDDCFPIYQASCQPPPRRILPPVMSIEPALNFTSGLTLAGGQDHPECPVCLSEFVEGDEIKILSNCRHGFHKTCIEPWLVSQISCPTCRNSCVTTSVDQNPPENQQQQPNDVNLEAANPPEIEIMVLPQQQQNGVHVQAASLPESEIVVVVLQQQQQSTE